jgi:hypothetical protein
MIFSGLYFVTICCVMSSISFDKSTCKANLQIPKNSYMLIASGWEVNSENVGRGTSTALGSDKPCCRSSKPNTDGMRAAPAIDIIGGARSNVVPCIPLFSDRPGSPEGSPMQSDLAVRQDRTIFTFPRANLPGETTLSYFDPSSGFAMPGGE